MDWKNNIIECNIWCYKDPNAEQELGIDMGGIWLPAIMDLAKASFVKTSGTTPIDTQIHNKGVIYYYSDVGIITDIDYEDLKIMFDKVNNYILVVPPLDN